MHVPTDYTAAALMMCTLHHGGAHGHSTHPRAAGSRTTHGRENAERCAHALTLTLQGRPLAIQSLSLSLSLSLSHTHTRAHARTHTLSDAHIEV